MLSDQLQILDELIAIYEARRIEEKEEDWKAYYGGFVDGLRKARETIDHPWMEK